MKHHRRRSKKPPVERVLCSETGKREYEGAVAKLGGEPRTLLSSSPGQHYGPACLDILEDPVDDHRVRVRLPVGKHPALPFPH
nr:hypothetical protein CYJ44_10530 [Corynebacterium aurimucosum]